MGGFVGAAQQTSFTRSANKAGTVQASVNNAGGFVGHGGAQSVVIENSYTTGAVRITGSGNNAGGFVGTISALNPGDFTLHFVGSAYSSGLVSIRNMNGFAVVGLAEMQSTDSEGNLTYHSAWNPYNGLACFYSTASAPTASGGELGWQNESLCLQESQERFLSSQSTFGTGGYAWDENYWTLVDGQMPKLHWEL